MIPLRAFQRRIAGNTDVSHIYISTKESGSAGHIKHNIERLLRERRRITNGKEDDFHLRDMREVMNTLTGTTRVLTALCLALLPQ